MEKVYRPSSYLFIAVLLMVFVGFYKTYFGLFPHFDGITAVLHVHAVTLLVWMGILIMQPFLIRGKKLELHRLIGKLSYVVMPLVVLTTGWIMRLAFIRNTPVAPGALDTRMIGIADLTFFVSSYLLAIYYRPKTSYHARYMAMTVLPFMNPALGRLGIPGPILALIILVGLLIYERFHNKIYRPYLIGLSAYLTIYLFFLVGINADQWKAFWWMFF
ncbi:hypothetical protein [Spirosoma areae]